MFHQAPHASPQRFIRGFGSQPSHEAQVAHLTSQADAHRKQAHHLKKQAKYLKKQAAHRTLHRSPRRVELQRQSESLKKQSRDLRKLAADMERQAQELRRMSPVALKKYPGIGDRMPRPAYPGAQGGVATPIIRHSGLRQLSSGVGGTGTGVGGVGLRRLDIDDGVMARAHTRPAYPGARGGAVDPRFHLTGGPYGVHTQLEGFGARPDLSREEFMWMEDVGTPGAAKFTYRDRHTGAVRSYILPK